MTIAETPTSTLPSGLAIVHSNRPENLRRVVVEHLRRFPLAPLEDEVVLVQSFGIGRWLQLAMAATADGEGLDGGLGISASVRFELPAQFIWSAYRTVLQDQDLPEQSLFDASRLRWLIFRLIEGESRKPNFEPIRHFLDADRADPRRRFQLAHALAELFEAYQFYRADWLADWEAGKDRVSSGRQRFEPLDAEQAWQPSLWRTLVEAGGAAAASHRARLHREFIAALERPDAVFAGLPRRLIVFGISALPEQTLRALAALARHSQVLVCLHNPCRYYWGNIVEARDDFRRWNKRHQVKNDQSRGTMPVRELADTEIDQWANPLLASWGKQGRDFIQLLDEMDRPEHYQHWFDDGIDLFEDVDNGQESSLLGQLQQGILDLEPLAPGLAREPIAADDRSISFTVAHSRQREVEILHDRLLESFERDKSLQPRDVIVMVPDIDAYAPHIEAVFGNLAGDDQDQRPDPRYIPFTIGDRNDRTRSGFLRAVEALLALPVSRFTTSAVLDLLEIPACRERFGLQDADMDLLGRWIEGSGVRWGLDGQHRSRLLDKDEGFEQNSWQYGLDRMLLGYANGQSDPFAEVLPYDEVTPGSAELVGKLAALVERLRFWHAELSRPAAAAAWVERLRTMTEDCLAVADGDDSLARHHFDRAVERLLEDTSQARVDEELPMEVVREVVLAELDRHCVSQRFLAGRVNFSTLMPMRAIPFRLVCMLGMNDGDYPRTRKPADFDLMDVCRRPGDRSRREDDRYLFLEALLSAREQLYISWIGRNLRDNAPIPPSVLVGQLRDAIASGWMLEISDGGDDGPLGNHDKERDAGQGLLKHLTTEHPLQPFSRAYFERYNSSLSTYAHEWSAVWQRSEKLAEASRNRALEAFPPESSLSLRDIESFYRSPARAFLSERLGVRLKRKDDLGLPPEDEPFALDGLQIWTLRDELLRRLMAVDVSLGKNISTQLKTCAGQQLELVRLEGRLPLKSFGRKIEESALEEAIEVGQRYFDRIAECPELRQPIPVRFRHVFSQVGQVYELGLEDWLGQVRQYPDGRLVRVFLQAGKVQRSQARNVSRANVRWDKLAAYWPGHLAACAQGLELTTYIVAADNEACLQPIPVESARQQLQLLLENWLAGMSRPLPALPALSGEFVRQLEANRTNDDDGWLHKTNANLRKLYEDEQGFGNSKRPAERDLNVDMARVFPDWESLWDLPDDDGFRFWSERIYGPMVLSLPYS